MTLTIVRRQLYLIDKFSGPVIYNQNPTWCFVACVPRPRLRSSFSGPRDTCTSENKLTHSVLGPDSGVGAGECLHCLVGPFVGFHHQSLLIATIWPLGRGNVGYGANVGSNHTSRQVKLCPSLRAISLIFGQKSGTCDNMKNS